MTGVQASDLHDAAMSLLPPAWLALPFLMCLPATVIALVRIRRWWNSGAPLPLPLDGAMPAVRWSAPAGLALFAAIYLAAFVVSAGYAAVHDLVTSEPSKAYDSFSPAVFLGQIVPVLIGAAAVAAFGRGALETVGVRVGGLRRSLVHGLAAFAVVFPLCVGALIINSILVARLGLEVEPPALLTTVREQPRAWTLVLAMLQAAALAPLAEEFTYRGVLLVSLMKRLGPATAIALSSGVFAVAHLGTQPQAVLPLFLLGVALGYTAYRTRALLAPILAHSLFNGLMVVGTYLWGGPTPG
jgi:membrane protease YdiL (CAAX protease family)